MFKLSFTYLYSQGNKSTWLRWACHVVRKEEGRSTFKILTDKLTGMRPLGSFEHRLGSSVLEIEMIQLQTVLTPYVKKFNVYHHFLEILLGNFLNFFKYKFGCDLVSF